VINDELIAGMGVSNPVPLEVHIDAMEILRKEIDKSLFFPLLFPHSSYVVTRTIDALFARRAENKENDDIESSDRDDEELGQSMPIYHHTERGLPLGWFEGVARDSGEKYYYNIETGMSSWERPVLENHQLKSPENEKFAEGGELAEDTFVTHADVAEVLVEPCETGFLLPVSNK
jgi:hypothetical protein